MKKDSKEKTREDQNRKNEDSTKKNEQQTGTGRKRASGRHTDATLLDSEALHIGRRTSSDMGSGMGTKSGVSGSDFDGQVSGR